MKLSSSKRSLFVLVSIFLLSICLSAVFVYLFPKLPVISDSKDYHDIAVEIVSNNTYLEISDGSILYPPLYPIFLSLIYKITNIGSFSSVYFIQYLLVGGISILVFLILKKFSRIPLVIALIASFLILFWPYFILYSQLISSEILYTFLLLLFFLLFLGISKSKGRSIAICAGITLGLAILTRPVALLLLPCIFIALLFIKNKPKFFGDFSLPWKKYFLVLFFMIIVILPWEIYVKVKYDRLIPISTNLSPVFDKANKTFSYLPQTQTPTSKNKILNIIEIKLKNIYLFWDPGASGYHLDIIKEKYPIASFAVSLYKGIFFVILILSAIGVFLHRKDYLIILCFLLIFYFWALHTVLFPFPRYTLPIIPYVIIVAMITFSHGFTLYKEKRANRLAGKK